MRRKIRKARLKIREPSPTSDDFDVHDGNGEHRVERNVHDDSGGHNDGHCVNNGGGVVHDSVNGRDGWHNMVKPTGLNEAFRSKDWSLIESCIVCNGADDRMLICYGEGCPVVLHDKCMSGEPDFDELGKFYCPYCWFKLKLLQHEVLRERVVLAEKHVVAEKFLVNGAVDGSREKEDVCGNETEERHSCGGTSNCRDWKDGMDDDEPHDKPAQPEKDRETKGYTTKKDSHDQDCAREFIGQQSNKLPFTPDKTAGSLWPEAKGSINGESMLETCELEVLGGGKTFQSESTKRSQESKHLKVKKEVLENKERLQAVTPRKTTDRMHEHIVHMEQGEPQNASSEEKEKSLDSAFDMPSQRKCDAVKGAVEGQRDVEEEQNPNAADSTISSPKSSDRSAECNRLALVVYQGNDVQKMNHKTSLQIIDSSNKASSIAVGDRRRQGKKCVATTSRGNRRNAIFVNQKRKRQFWTHEEEEMLKEGVHMFAATAYKNIPWRKILENGRGIFHEERTPMDLKDKWKNMKRAS